MNVDDRVLEFAQIEVASLEQWNSSGRDIAAEFDAVVDCSGRHEMAMSFPINAADGAPRDGVVLFYACTLKDGKTVADAYAAHLESGTAMKAMGSQGLSWFFQPALGTGPIDFDYYWARTGLAVEIHRTENLDLSAMPLHAFLVSEVAPEEEYVEFGIELGVHWRLGF